MAVGEQVKACDVALKFVESGRVRVEGIVIHRCSSNNAREAFGTAAGTEGVKATVMCRKYRASGNYDEIGVTL